MLLLYAWTFFIHSSLYAAWKKHGLPHWFFSETKGENFFPLPHLQPLNGANRYISMNCWHASNISTLFTYLSWVTEGRVVVDPGRLCVTDFWWCLLVSSDLVSSQWLRAVRTWRASKRVKPFWPDNSRLPQSIVCNCISDKKSNSASETVQEGLSLKYSLTGILSNPVFDSGYL